jgi:hypothetical protein
MAQVVQLELMVDEKGAVQGVRAFDTAIKTGTGSVQQLNQELAAAGVTATSTGRQASTELRRLRQEARATREGVHLLTEEFGIEMPRAFRSLIAESKAAKVAINAVGTGIMALGGIQVGVMVFQQIAEGAEKAYDKWVSLRSVVASVDELMQRLGQDTANATKSQIAATEQYIQLTQGAAAAGRYRLQQLQGAPVDLKNTYQSKEFQGYSDKIKGQIESITGQSVMPKDLDATVKKVQAYNDALQRNLSTMRQEEAAYEKTYLSAQKSGKYHSPQEFTYIGQQIKVGKDVQENLQGNQGNIAMQAKLIGAQIDKATSDDAKKGSGEAKKNASEREAREREFAQIHERAVEAALSGSALYHQQEAAAIDDLKQRHLDTAQAVEDVHTRFHAEEMKRLQDESNEVRKAREQTAMGGLTGAARVQQEGRNRVNDIYATANTRSPGATLALIHNADQQTAQELGALQQNFGQRVDEVVRAATDRTLSGFAKIHADADKQIADLRKLAGTDHGGPQDMSRGEAAIRRSEGAEVGELNQKYSDETARIEAQAQARSMSAEKQQTLALQAELAERLRLYQEQHDKQGLSEEDFERRQAAAWQEYNAGMVEQSRRAREKMAGEFSSLFKSLDHPAEALKELGDKAAGQAAAAMVQRAQNHFGIGTGNAGQQGESHGMMGGIFDRIAGTPRGVTSDRRAEQPGRGPNASGLLSLSTAQIRIGSASISFGGMVGGPGGSSTGMANGNYASPLSGGTSGSFVAGSGGSTYAAADAGFSGVPGIGLLTSSSSAHAMADAGVPGTRGGAGDSGIVASAPMGLIGTGGSAPASGSGLRPALSNGQQAFNLGSSMKGLFHKSSSASTSNAELAEVQHQSIDGEFDKDGNFVTKNSSNGGMSGGGGFKANAAGAATGAMGLFGAYESNGGVGGALSGAMSGMQLGNSLAGPWGAAVGAAAGAVMGVIGFGGREKARVYDLQQVRPRIANDKQSYEQGGDYLSVYSDVQSLDVDAKKTTNSYGPAAQSYYQDTIKKEIQQAEQDFTRMQKAGRSQFTSQPAAYATGTDYVPETGMALIHEGERILPSDQNERLTRALEAGVSQSSVAQGYRTTMQSAGARQQSSGGAWSGDLHIHAIDAKSGVQWIMRNRHVIRSAVNSSFAENSGGADA